MTELKRDRPTEVVLVYPKSRTQLNKSNSKDLIVEMAQGSNISTVQIIVVKLAVEDIVGNVKSLKMIDDSQVETFINTCIAKERREYYNRDKGGVIRGMSKAIVKRKFFQTNLSKDPISHKLESKNCGPFIITAVHGNNVTLDLVGYPKK
ncbi:hypothetical protein ACTFIW_008829 [Dictyostelium discoideum]